MTTTTYTTTNAPGFAKHSSSFRNDDRCYEVHFVVGDNEDEVWRHTASLFLNSAGLIDYDVNYSTEGDAYVGVTAKDY